MFNHLFKELIIAIPMGLFFALMITNIYLLLLYTLSNNPFPVKASSRGRTISLAIRFGFIGFIAVLMAKPIELALYKVELDVAIAAFKDDKIKKYKAITNKAFDNEIQQFRENEVHEIRLFDKLRNSGKMNKIIQIKEEEKKQLNNSMYDLVHHSDYFIQRIFFLQSNHKESWFCSLGLILLFVTPAFLKGKVGESSDYFQKKQEIHLRIVRSEYEAFKADYSAIMSSSFNKELEFSESYLDPPFNQERKVRGEDCKEEMDLLNQLYPYLSATSDS